MTEGLNTRALAIVAALTVAITAILVAVAWFLVAPTPAATRLPASPIEHDGFAARGQLGARLPVPQAIDRVVADPSLIGGHR